MLQNNIPPNITECQKHKLKLLILCLSLKVNNLEYSWMEDIQTYDNTSYFVLASKFVVVCPCLEAQLLHNQPCL